MITGSPISKMSDVLHALCNAHLLRELKALEGDHEAWAFNMSALLRTISHLCKTDLADIYDDIMSEGFIFHNSKYPFLKPAIPKLIESTLSGVKRNIWVTL